MSLANAMKNLNSQDRMSSVAFDGESGYEKHHQLHNQGNDNALILTHNVAVNKATNVNDDTCTVHSPERVSSPIECRPDSERVDCANTLFQLVPNKVVHKHAGSDLTVAQEAVPKRQPQHSFNKDFFEKKHRKRPLNAWNVLQGWINRNIDTACDTNNTDLSAYNEHDTIKHLLKMENYMEPATALGESKANGAKKRKKNKDYRPMLITDKYALGRFWKEVEKNEEYKNLSESIHAVAEAEQTLWRQLSAESGQNLDPHLYKEISEVIQEVKRGFQCSEGAQVNPGESDKQRESNETVHKFVYNTFAA